jgi:two-component system phosphate regulon sensor histidine kinase PhoR
MTHEFKTPIATISLASDSILSPSIINNEDKIKRFLGIIKQENTRMLNQVEKVLQMARIDKREFELNLTKVNVHDTITKAVENSRLKVEVKEGIIDTKFSAGIAEIDADQNHLSNVINNLLDNAVKYSTEKPHIVVTTRNINDFIEIAVQDNGIGMTKESQKYIFNKFYRVHTGNRHDVKGFGLGLSYVKALAEAHRGEISVKSELGKGSVFILKIPILQSDQT